MLSSALTRSSTRNTGTQTGLIDMHKVINPKGARWVDGITETGSQDQTGSTAAETSGCPYATPSQKRRVKRNRKDYCKLMHALHNMSVVGFLSPVNSRCCRS